MFIVELTPELLGLENKVGAYNNLQPTISVRAILWNEKNQIAVVHAKWNYYLPGWSTDGEPLEIAIRREIKEEIGATMKDIEYVGLVREYRMYTEEGSLIENHIFTAKVDGDLWTLDLTEEEKREWHEVHWYSIMEAKDLLAKALLDTEDPHSILVLQRSLSALEEYTDVLDKKSLTVSNWDEKKIKELEEIAKKAQYDYVMLKGEFDSYVKRVQGEDKENKLAHLIDTVKRLSPIIDQLGQSIDHIPDDLEWNTWVEGVSLMYENTIKILGELSISRIRTIGEEPDMELHDPLSVEPIEEESLKGKIIKEFSPWYVYEKDGIRKVIKAAKVIVGQ